MIWIDFMAVKTLPFQFGLILGALYHKNSPRLLRMVRICNMAAELRGGCPITLLIDAIIVVVN